MSHACPTFPSCCVAPHRRLVAPSRTKKSWCFLFMCLISQWSMNTTSPKSFALTPKKRDLGGAGFVFWQISQSLTTPSFWQAQLACSASELCCAHAIVLESLVKFRQWWRHKTVQAQLSFCQNFHLRLVEEEVEVERLLQVSLLELDALEV